VYGREPSEQEIKLGIDYLHSEPLKEFEENKLKPADTPAGGRGGRGGGGGAPAVTTDAAKPATEGGAVAADAAPAAAADGAAPMGMGMMGGMGGFPGGFGGAGGGRRGPGAGAPTTVKYVPTAWGRYAKVLFSSSEFLFIN